MIVEYCPFQNLKEFIKLNHNRIKEKVIAPIIHSIVSGIAYLHRHGICHRDIKPENILFNPKSGELKIIDFGIAKMCKYTNQRLEMWTNTGTLHFKAPEMFNGSYNEIIDMWAVGVIAYEMIFKKYPFDNEYVCNTITAICEEEPEYDSTDVSPFLLQFIKRCLTKDPFKRLTSA